MKPATLWELTAEAEELADLLDALCTPLDPKSPFRAEEEQAHAANERRLAAILGAMAPDAEGFIAAIAVLEQPDITFVPGEPGWSEKADASYRQSEERAAAQLAITEYLNDPSLANIAEACRIVATNPRVGAQLQIGNTVYTFYCPNHMDPSKWLDEVLTGGEPEEAIAAAKDVAERAVIVQQAQEVIDRFKAHLAERLKPKLDGWARVYWVRKREGEAAEAEALRLKRTQKAKEGAAERIKQTLHTIFSRLGIRKVQVASGTIALRPNGGLPSVRVCKGQELRWDPFWASPVTIEPRALLDGAQRVREYLESLPPSAQGKPLTIEDRWEILNRLGVDLDAVRPNRDRVLKSNDEDDLPEGLETHKGEYLDIR